MEARLQADPCLFIEGGEWEGPEGSRWRDKNITAAPCIGIKRNFNLRRRTNNATKLHHVNKDIRPVAPPSSPSSWGLC